MSRVRALLETKSAAVEPECHAGDDGHDLEVGGLPALTRQDRFLESHLSALPNKGIPRSSPGLRLPALSPNMPKVPRKRMPTGQLAETARPALNSRVVAIL